MPTEPGSVGPGSVEPGSVEPGSVERCRMELTDDGPLLVSGPVQVVLADGSTVESDRPVSALCLCRRSRRYPWCDTSHRTKRRVDAQPATAEPTTEETTS